MSPARFVGLAAALGTAVAVAVSHPLPLRLASAFLEDGSYDAYQFAWNLWWVAESVLRLHTNPFFTTYIYYPEGVPLLFHTFSFSLGVASLPLQPAFGLVATHNLLVLAAPLLTVVTVALLAREVTGDATASLAAGLVAAVNPIAVWFLPVLYLSCTYLMAGLLLAWWRLQRRRRAGDVALALAVLAALLFASQEYAMIALSLLALDTAWRVLVPRRLGLGAFWPAGTAAFWGLAAAGLGTIALVALSAPASPPPILHLLVASGYAAGFVTPPWVEAPVVRFWTVLYLGTVPLLCVPLALGWGGRRAVFWGLAAVSTALMALGPYLHLHHPLPDMRLPPEGFPISGPPGPYLVASWVLPLLRFLRTPYRWVVGTQLALAMLVALAVAALRMRVGERRRAALTVGLLVLLAAGAALDVRGLRAPLVSAAVPSAYRVLRDDPEPAAVLELPSGLVRDGFAAFSSLYMYYQTTHRKYLLEGTVARLPPRVLPVVWRAADDLVRLPYVKYVLVHRDLLPSAHPASRAQTERIEATLRREGATLLLEEGGIAVYRLPTFRGPVTKASR